VGGLQRSGCLGEGGVATAGQFRRIPPPNVHWFRGGVAGKWMEYVGSLPRKDLIDFGEVVVDNAGKFSASNRLSPAVSVRQPLEGTSMALWKPSWKCSIALPLSAKHLIFPHACLPCLATQLGYEYCASVKLSWWACASKETLTESPALRNHSISIDCYISLLEHRCQIGDFDYG
jgi:hypothetical protein